MYMCMSHGLHNTFRLDAPISLPIIFSAMVIIQLQGEVRTLYRTLCEDEEFVGFDTK